jgi:hypothetical protein
MKNIQRFLCAITLGLLMQARGAGLADLPAARTVLSLDGVWSFATDPDDRGETGKWYLPDTKLPAMPLPGYAPTADGTIRVPGIWDNQGYGTETGKLRHNFVGKGWYKRTVEIPRTWAGRRTFLAVTGISRYSKIWINGHYLGEHIGSLSVQEYDISQLATPGQTVTVTIQVDSKQRWEVDTLSGCWSLADYVHEAWGGIWGHVRLEARADAWLADLFVQPDVPGGSCSAGATLGGKAGLADGARLEVFDQDGRRVADADVKLDPALAAGQPVSVQVALPGAQLWTPDTPALYTARLSLLNGAQVLDTADSRFGMRQFTVDGYKLLLNGKRMMLRGYGDDHIYPEQMAMPSDKELHLTRLRLIKSYGFNHVRHHSTVMPPEYYEACDEVGIITTVEFPICYASYIPGSGGAWKDRTPPGTDPEPALDTYRREWTAVITQNRNHPSILCWVMGNELWGGLGPRFEFQQKVTELDPQGLFLDSDGDRQSILLDPELDRSTLAMYSIPFSVSGDPVVNTNKFSTPKPVKPVLSHEAGNYVTFSRPDLVDEFQHNVKPFWMSEGKAKLEKLGLLQEAAQWADKSERLYAFLHKCNLESLRRNPCLSGYHWWLFQDYWTTANGLVDHYFRPKSITREEVLAFNSEVVLLKEGLEMTYRGNSRLDLKLLVSNFSPGPLQGELIWEVKAGGQTLATKTVPVGQIPQGDVAGATAVGLVLPELTAPSKLSITARLSADGKQYGNDWSAWLYPSATRPAASPVPVFASVPQSRGLESWGLAPIPVEGELDARAVYVTDSLFDQRLVDAMDRGACVVCLGGADPFLQAYPLTFRTSWWKAGDKPERNHTGTFVYDHPATRTIAPDGWCDGGWFHLVQGAKKYVLEDAPARPDVIVRALSSMAMVQDEALLFAVGVGRGSLVVSGLNHAQADGRPENEWLLARLIDYAATLPHPKAIWPASFLARVEAAPEGCLPGFRCMAANIDGTVAEKTAWYSYRADAVPVFICRQDKKGNAVTWETVPYIPAAQPDERVTFVFAGALGYSSQPATEGFALDINGKEVLRFDMPAPEQWVSADQRVELRFEPRRSVSVDQFGLFYVTVARDLLTPGKPCQLGIRSMGTGSRRWFGLNPYTDVR